MIIGMYLTDRCNLRCSYCRPRGLKYDDKGVMTPDVAVKVDALYPRAIVRLTGHGEPATSPNLGAIIHAVRRHHTTLVTNGTLLHKANVNWKDLRRANISMSEASAEEYQETCGINRFDRVVKNVAMLRKNGVIVVLSFVIHAQNIGRIGRYGALCRKLGINGIQLQPVRGFGDEEEFWSKYALLPNAWTIRRLRKQLSVLKGYGMNVSMPRLFDRNRIAASCRQLAMYMAVGPHGFVAPCCGGNGPEERFGSIMTDGVKAFISPTMQAYRKAFLSSNRPPECALCHLNYETSSWGVPCN